MATTARQRFLLIAFGLAVGIFFFIAVELVLSALGLGDAARFSDPYAGFAGSTSLFELREIDGNPHYVTREEKLAFFNEQGFPAEKTPDTLRVFTLGGSTVAGRPYDDHLSFSRNLERYLDAAEPGRRHEVINAGGVSYASYRVARVLEEVLDYEPDLIVLYTGHNEFLEERTYDEALRSQSPWQRRLRLELSRFRFAALIWGVLGDQEAEAELAPEAQTRLEVWTGLQSFERDDALAEDITQHFALNIERMVKLCSDRGTELLVVRPISNLKDFSPFKSEPDAALAPEQKRRAGELMQEGKYKLALEIDPRYAAAWFHYGRELLAQGATEEAREAFVKARDFDLAPLRAPSSILQALDDVVERQGVPTLDLPALLVHSIPGDEQLLDHVHPDLPIHQKIAAETLDFLVEKKLVQITENWTPETRSAIDQEVLEGLDAAYYAQRDLNLGKVLGWAGKLDEAEAPLRRAAEVLDGLPDLHLTLGTLLQRTQRFEEAQEHLARTTLLSPDSAAAHFNHGVVLARLGHLEKARSALDESLRLDPEQAAAWHNLGVVRRDLGDSGGAVEALERALALRGEAPEIHRALAATFARDGRLQEADDALRIAREVAPGDAQTWYEIGLLRRRQERFGDALDAYRRAVEIDPAHLLAHNNLAILAAQAGDDDLARQHLERVIALDPNAADAHLNLGVVHDRAGRSAEALASIERAATLRPEDPRIARALAALYQAQGKSR